ETFVVSEIIAREEAGAAIEILSLRPPVDPRFHDTLARVQAPVTYVPRVRRADEVWARLRAASVLDAPDARTWDLLLDADPEDASQALDLAVQVRERGVTHLHAHFASMATTVARLAAGLAGVTYSFTAHAKDLFHESVSDEDVAAKSRDAHHVVTISAYNVAHLVGIGAPPESLHLVHNGLDLTAFAPRTPPSGARAPGTLRVAAVGRFVEKKGFDVLLDAVALLRSRGEAVHCDLVGAGEADAALRAQAQALGLGPAVTFHGPLPQDQVRRVVGGADVFAAPCVVGADGNADGLPTVVLEAMALGTPCVTTDVTGLVEAIDQEQTGLLVDQHDAVGLADALARIGRDPELAARLATQARTRVEQRFDSVRQAHALNALLPTRPAPAPPSPLGSLRGRRVAYVCADPGIDVFGTKGASVHVQEVVRVLRAAGAEVELFARRASGTPPADLADVLVHRLASCPPGMTGADRERWLLSQDHATADAVAAHGPYDLLYERYSLFSAAALTAAAGSGPPSVLEVNAPLVAEQAEHRGLVHADAAWDTLRRAAGAAGVVACVSEPVRDWVREHVSGAAAVVAANGVNTERITPRPVTIGFVGTLKPWHGVEGLLEAAAPLLQDRAGTPAPVRLLLIGDGPRAEAIDARARELGVAEHVERTGAVDPADVPRLLHRIDVAVAPYPATAERYFSPLKVYEYLAAGLAVVASDVGQIPAVVRDGETGLLTPASDVAALTAALRRLVDDAALRDRLGAAGRDLVVAQHSWRHTVARILAHVPEAVAR
ncbi:MAG: glycosyltransferase family 4 protein, partial [Cellulomonadaceae bacterium]